MKRIATVIALLALLAAGCSSGTAAPEPRPLVEVCTSALCLEVPVGWGDEVGDTHIAFNHEAAPEETFLTANVIDMEAIVTAAGGSWPVPPSDVIVAFWSLIEDADEGELIRTERLVGGAIRSWGRHSTGDMWFLLVPGEGSSGVGVEIRGPNDSWEAHADAVFPTVTLEG